MKLVAAKCPNCMANIEVDKNSDKTVCEYCGSKIIVEDAIAKFKLEVSGQVEVSNLTNFDKLFKLGNRSFSSKNYKEAKDYYVRAIELNPDDPIVVLKLGFCECFISSFSNLNVTKLKNDFVESCRLVKDDEDKKVIINSFVRQTVDVLDVLVENINNYKKKKSLSSHDCDVLVNKYNDCLSTYEACYDKVIDDDSLLDTVYSKIIKTITLTRSVNRYLSGGKYRIYRINAALLSQLNQKADKYNSEYAERHPQPVNEAVSNTKTKVAGGSNPFANLSKPVKIILFSFIGFFWLLCILVIIGAIFGDEYYEGVWTSESEKINIDDKEVIYYIDEEKVYSGEYKKEYSSGAYIITFKDYAFKTEKKNNKMYFCKIESKDKKDCTKYYNNADLEDVELVDEEELD